MMGFMHRKKCAQSLRNSLCVSNPNGSTRRRIVAREFTRKKRHAPNWSKITHIHGYLGQPLSLFVDKSASSRQIGARSEGVSILTSSKRCLAYKPSKIGSKSSTNLLLASDVSQGSIKIQRKDESNVKSRKFVPERRLKLSPSLSRNIAIITAIVIAISENAPTSLASPRSQRDYVHGVDDFYHTDDYSFSPRSLNPWTNWFGNWRQNRNSGALYGMENGMQPVPDHSYSKDQDNFSLDPNQSSSNSGNLPHHLHTSMSKREETDTLDAHIKNILVPRVSGTQGNVDVRNYIINVLKANNYQIELDEFTAPTPIGNVKFSNIIGSSNPKACRQIVLACHYDSKMMDNFLGATDSAVPCAMLLKISETFASAFRPQEDKSDETSLGLRFVFFDGEEAFVQWSDTDSLYGSRHLAEKWEKRAAPPQCQSRGNELKRIELMVLLDLIGSSDTSFVIYNNQLKHHYDALRDFERTHLMRSGLSQVQARREMSFKNSYIPLALVQDDHVPFMRRGVPILSLLAHPFPKVWHTIQDNYDIIDFKKTRRLVSVLENFVATYERRIG